MLKNISICKKLIISILIGCLLPYIITSSYVSDKTQEWAYQNNIEHSNLMLKQTAERIDSSMLENTKNLVDMISKDTRILDLNTSINSYINYGDPDFKLKNSEPETFISNYFRSIGDSHPLIDIVSFGTESGGYIEYPAFQPNAPYDPRLRDWYIDAISTDSAIISEPYLTQVTKDLVISVDKKVSSNNSSVGVISLTIKLDSLINDIDKMKFGKTGYINILSPNNVFINSPTHLNWMLKSVDELNLDIFNDVDSYNESAYEATLDSTEKVFNVYISPYSGWKYIAVIDKSELLLQSKHLTDSILLIYALFFMLILILIVLISNRITKPILNITNTINSMSNFDFDAFESKNMDLYITQRDEIGEISRALNSMQSNFTELKNNLSAMDAEIKNIEIGKKAMYQLSLSKNNPLSTMVKSVNLLLQKVHFSFEEINKINAEMLYQNELLVASEEELTAQLEEIDSQKEYISFLADHDPLTNLPNRRQFYMVAKKELLSEYECAVIMLDIDNFKSINDTLGHLFGDKVLIYISDKMNEMNNPNLFISRFGGDEFLLLYSCTQSNTEIYEFVDVLFSTFENSFIIDDTEIKLEFSIGISISPNDSTDIDQLIMNADLALYHVKNNGKNNFSFFNKYMTKTLQFKQNIKLLLNEAILNNGFKMVYQPQININNGEIIGFESLVRLKEIVISPAEFIPIAEEYGLIIPIGRIVTKLVIEELYHWKLAGFDLKPVSINFSANQINDLEYYDYLLNLLKQYDINPKYIVIEITENIFLENKNSTIELLNKLRAHNIKIAVDDFGTGYSSLSYLTFLPVDTVKFDKSLSTKFLELENIAVMDSLIALAHSLNLTVIAEGIEEYEQVHRLMVGKCDIIQGYYFSKPLDAKDIDSIYNKVYHLNAQPQDA